MKISIVIPTLNEEKYLPGLLKDLSKQTFKDYEIIVADANSKDKTREIAKKYKAKIVQGGHPGIGRNNGAKIARGEFIFFLDADVRLEKDFLERAYKEIKERKLNLATCEFIPLSNLLIDKVMHNFSNMYIKINQYSNPHAGGCCIIVNKDIFNKANGFNESLKLAEDHDFVKRASKFSQLRVLKNTNVKISVRRLEKEGRLNLIKKYMQVNLHRRFKGEITEDIINYEFGNFETSKDKIKETNSLSKKLDKEYSNLSKIPNKQKIEDLKYKLNNILENLRKK